MVIHVKAPIQRYNVGDFAKVRGSDFGGEVKEIRHKGVTRTCVISAPSQCGGTREIPETELEPLQHKYNIGEEVRLNSQKVWIRAIYVLNSAGITGYTVSTNRSGTNIIAPVAEGELYRFSF